MRLLIEILDSDLAELTAEAKERNMDINYLAAEIISLVFQARRQREGTSHARKYLREAPIPAHRKVVQ